MPAHATAASQTAPSSRSIDELIRSAVDLARTCLGMDVGFVTEFKDGMRIFRHVASAEGYSPIRPGDADPLDQSYCHRIVTGEIPGVVCDSHEYPVLKALSVTEALQIRTYLGVPIRFSDDSVFGTFCCYSRAPRASMSGFNIDAMSRFAALIGQLLETRVQEARARDRLVERLQGVLAGGQLNVVYQPVYDVARQTVIGYEALARFSAEPVRTPDRWFDEAHQVDLGDRMEMLAINKALDGLARIPVDTYLALNVSPQTILSGALEAALAQAPLARLVLELTEHSSISDYGIISEKLACLHAAGGRRCRIGLRQLSAHPQAQAGRDQDRSEPDSRHRSRPRLPRAGRRADRVCPADRQQRGGRRR